MTEKSLINFRRDLHQHPELSGYEIETQKRIQAFIQNSTGLIAKNIGQFGSLYRFDSGADKRILVRVDCDALPIQEINDFEYRSKFEGISHKCGHDGHTAIGAGLVQKLKANPINGINVDVIFQPAEEIGEGAQGIINDPGFKLTDYQFAVALHNIPGAEMHQVLWKHGGFTPAVQSLVIRLDGKTAHAAMPLTGQNPGYAISEIIAWAKANEQTDEKHPDYNLITPVYANLGSKDYGISAGHGEVHFTIRSWEQKRMEEVTSRFLNQVKQIANAHQLKLNTDFTAAFAANQNDAAVVKAIAKSARNLGLNETEKTEPFPWGEDFGLFTQHIPGAMFGLGSGLKTPSLHNPDYDYPDEITETGVNLFYEIIKELAL